MGNYTFQCPSCQTSVEADDSYAGQQAECPNCKHIITIPLSQSQNPSPISLKPLASSPQIDLKPIVTPQPCPSNFTGKQNFCPNCRVNISENIQFCPNCGYRVNPQNNTSYTSSANASTYRTSNEPTITEIICGKTAAREGKFSVRAVRFMAITGAFVPIVGLFWLVGFILLVSTNENHKHDTLMFQMGMLCVSTLIFFFIWLAILTQF